MTKTIQHYLLLSILTLGLAACSTSENSAHKEGETTAPEVSKKTVSVNHEWGSLKEVVIGRLVAANMVIPPIDEAMKKEVNYIPEEVIESLVNSTGKKFIDVFPEFVTEFEQQADHFAKIAAENGAEVKRNVSLPPSEKTGPDYFGLQLYTRDPILVIGNKVIITNLRSPWRRVEKIALEGIVEEIKADYDAEVIFMPENKDGFDSSNVYIEGGDVILNGYDIYVGHSGHATNMAGIEWLKETLGPKYRVHVVQLRDDVLHLDCSLMLLNDSLGVICKSYILSDLPESLSHYDWVEATEDEAQIMGTNGCIINSSTVIMDAHHPRIAEELRKKNHTVIEIPYEAGKALGGGLRCSHHPLWRESQL